MYIKTKSGVLGRFERVEVVLDGVVADGVLFLLVVLGEYEIIDDKDYKPPVDLTALQKVIVSHTQNRLDNFASSRGYDGILSACTYVASQVPRFASDGQIAVRLRDATWAKLYDIMAEVETGKRAVPAGFGDVEHDLPALAWESA